MKTKGALVWDFHQPWSVEEIEIGDPRKGEVKVALEVAGMCHSDHHIVTGDIPVAAFPVLGATKAQALSSRSAPASTTSRPAITSPPHSSRPAACVGRVRPVSATCAISEWD